MQCSSNACRCSIVSSGAAWSVCTLCPESITQVHDTRCPHLPTLPSPAGGGDRRDYAKKQCETLPGNLSQLRACVLLDRRSAAPRFVQGLISWSAGGRSARPSQRQPQWRRHRSNEADHPSSHLPERSHCFAALPAGDAVAVPLWATGFHTVAHSIVDPQSFRVEQCFILACTARAALNSDGLRPSSVSRELG